MKPPITRATVAGVLLAAYNVRRPTADVDFAGQDFSNEVTVVSKLIVEIASRRLEDGIQFDTSGVVAEAIRDEDTYGGVRVTLRAQVASARLPFHIDVNVGDPILPAPVQIQLPRLLGGDLSLRGYPLPMVIAEKLVTAVQRATANTRWRDYADIYLLTRRHPLAGNEIQTALATVARFRNVRLRRTVEVLRGYAEIGQSPWARWRRKHSMAELIPPNFADVLAHTTDFADPAIDQAVAGFLWDPDKRSWAAE